MRRQNLPGTFIVIEGADGAGTTTQAEKLAEALDGNYTAEPTKDLAGEKVEQMISSGDHSAEAIALMFAADRKTHLEEEVIPKLKKGEIVVSDRYYHSSLVYQPTLGADYSWVLTLNKHTIEPDLTIILDVPTKVALSRIDERERDIKHEEISEKDRSEQTHLTFFNKEDGEGGNIFENLGFQEEVATRYRKLPEELDEEIAVVDSSDSIKKVAEKVREKCENRIPDLE